MTAQISSNRYGAAKTVSLKFQEAVERSKKVLEENGWGVMSEINVSGAMKQKLGVDFPPYMILGACNPPLANKALNIDKFIGLLMPCNLVVQEKDGKVEVSVVDAENIVAATGNKDLTPIGQEANKQLKKVLELI